MARQKKSINDEDWPEVESINSYAVFMGYLLMGVRGLGLLVLTWTTVVLLGGFVSMLQKKDFWCLTAITLVQTAGVFDFLLKEKASDVGNSLKGLLAAVGAAVVRPFKKETNTSAKSSNIIKKDRNPSIARLMVGIVLLLVQLLVLGIVLCPLAVLYVLGLYLSAGFSLWRLIQHDYGNPDGANPDGAANLKPALNILYFLAVAQGVVYGYRALYDSAARTGLVEGVAEDYSLETDLVSDYLEETVAGCMKDPSFARGRNLITYAVDLLIECKSRYGYISGVLILGRVTHRDKTWWNHGQSGLIKQLLARSASFSHVVQQLVETFGPTSPYNTEIRVQAARIVGNVAGSVRLEQLPNARMIECISSLLDTFEEYSWRPGGHRDQVLYKEYARGWLLDKEEQWYSYFVDSIPTPTAADNGNLLDSYEDLVMQGLRILQKLAINEDNCRVLAKNAQGLLSKTMAHLISDKLHGDHHDKWSIIAMESLEFMNRLMSNLGLGGTETTKLRSQISSNCQATIFRTLECHKCEVLLKGQVTQVLLHLSPDTLTSIVPGGSGSSSVIFIWILLDIFLLPDYHLGGRMSGSTHLAKKSSDIARLACEKMQDMICSKKCDTSMLPSVVGDVIGSLAKAVVGAENKAYRIHAATILKNLCEHYTKDDENLKELKKAMANVMPEVLKEIVHWPTTEEIQVAIEANNGGEVLLTEDPDLEQGGSSHDNNGQESSSTTHQQKGDQHPGIIQLQQALLDLCDTIKYRWIPEDQDLTRQFNDIAAKICSGQGMPDKTFRELVGEALQDCRLDVPANSSSETET